MDPFLMPAGERRPTTRGESDSAANKRRFFMVLRETYVDEEVLHSIKKKGSVRRDEVWSFSLTCSFP